MVNSNDGGGHMEQLINVCLISLSRLRLFLKKEKKHTHKTFSVQGSVNFH